MEIPLRLRVRHPHPPSRRSESETAITSSGPRAEPDVPEAKQLANAYRRVDPAEYPRFVAEDCEEFVHPPVLDGWNFTPLVSPMPTVVLGAQVLF